MKMAKKLLAIVLTGVMAMSVLTGCADIKTRKVADELEGMLKTVNTKATVSTSNSSKGSAEDLAKKAAKAAKADTTDFKVFAADGEADEKETKTEIKQAVKTAIDSDKITDKYVWATCFATKDVKNAAQAQKIFAVVVDAAQKKINTSAALNSDKVKVGEKSGTAIEAGNKFELGMETFTMGTGKNKVDYVMVVVTNKPVEKAAAVTPTQPANPSEGSDEE